jgi:hypothetical protein
MTSPSDRWPALRYGDWKDTAETLQLWTQIAGKIRLARTPWLNHSWHVTFYVSPRGLTTGPIPDVAGSLARTFSLEFDFLDHALIILISDGHTRQVMLRPVTVAQFYDEVMLALRELGIEVAIKATPNEVANPVPFAQDTVHKSYDAEYAQRFWRVLSAASHVMMEFRSSFLGKVSPVHFFWGSFDLAVTRFSGRRAPRHPGGVPALPDDVAREAYSHEVSSAGFWPGGGLSPYTEAAFYSYAYPAPGGFAEARVKPAEALWHKELGEFLLPYEEMRGSSDPDRMLMEFLVSTYEAAADLGKWDRAALECEIGRPGKVRPA